MNIAALWLRLWQFKGTVAICMVVGGLGALVYALLATPIYRAQVTVAEVSSGGNNGLNSLSGQLGDVASIVGLNLGPGGTNREAEALLRSRHLVELFINRHGPLSQFFPDDTKRNSLWFVVRRFQRDVISFNEDKARGTTVVAFEWTDPTICARWANEFVALANDIIRTRAMDESRRNISYLNEQITKTSIVAVQQALSNLIENETKTLMVANGREEYAFTVVDPAVAPEVRARPQRVLLVAMGLVAGLIIGGVIAFSSKTPVAAKRSRS